MADYVDPGTKLPSGAVFAGWSLPRSADGIKCMACCRGYADRVSCTAAECEQYGCGRDLPGRECCARAFLCAACGVRNVGECEAPDMD